LPEGCRDQRPHYESTVDGVDRKRAGAAVSELADLILEDANDKMDKAVQHARS
jgi:hypothetical protein